MKLLATPVVQYPRWLKPHYGIVAALAQIGLSFVLPSPLSAITAALCAAYNVFGWGYMLGAGSAGSHYLRGMGDAFAFARKLDSAFLEAAKRGLSPDEAAAEVKEKLGFSEEPKH